MEPVAGNIYRIKVKAPPFPFILAIKGKGGGDHLSLSESGQSMTPVLERGNARQILNDLREAGRGRYVARGAWVYFVPSREVDPRLGSRPYVIAAKTTVNPKVVTVMIALATSLLVWGSYERFQEAPANPAWLKTYKARYRTMMSIAVARAILASMVLLLAGCAVYGVSIAYGMIAGHTWPTAAYSILVDPAGWIQVIERQLPRLLVVVAVAGAASLYLAQHGLLTHAPLRHCELRMLWGWRRCGWAVVPAILLFGLSSGSWSGLLRESDYQYASLFGAVPYTDASGYFYSALHQPLHGEWIQFGARRPVAQAARDLLVLLGGARYDRVLIVQAVIQGLALNVAALRIAAWRGVWAGLAFLGLIILQTRIFIPTTLTEPLGMTVGLLAMPLIVDALRNRSISHALLALTLIALALSIRMGALLLLPAMVAWAAFAVAERRWRWSTAAAGLSLLAAVVIFGRVLTTFYAPHGALTGGNFALTLCGLSVGGDWSVCQYKLYAKELAEFAGDEAGAAAWALRQALRNFAETPLILIKTVLLNVLSYVGSFIKFHAHGYAGQPRLPSTLTQVMFLALLPGIAYTLVHRAARNEQVFWGLTIAAILGSAAIVMRDDGWRALHVTHALTVLLLAFGLSLPGVLTLRLRPVPVRHASIGLALGCCVLLAAPFVARLSSAQALAPARALNAASGFDAFVGGNRLTGILVVPDGTPRSPVMPNVSVRNFQKIFATNMSTDADVDRLVAVVRERAPVAFVMAQPIKGKVQIYLLAPPEVLERREVRLWWIADEKAPIVGAYLTIRDVRSVGTGE